VTEAIQAACVSDLRPAYHNLHGPDVEVENKIEGRKEIMRERRPKCRKSADLSFVRFVKMNLTT
jgi:hypothetical protein